MYMAGIVRAIPSNDPLILPALCIVSSVSNITELIIVVEMDQRYTMQSYKFAGSSLVTFSRIFLWIWDQRG